MLVHCKKDVSCTSTYTRKRGGDSGSHLSEGNTVKKNVTTKIYTAWFKSVLRYELKESTGFDIFLSTTVSRPALRSNQPMK